MVNIESINRSDQFNPLSPQNRASISANKQELMGVITLLEETAQQLALDKRPFPTFIQTSQKQEEAA